MKKLVYLVLVLGLIVIAGCQQQATVKPTYQTANQVQTALNQNKQLKGKTGQTITLKITSVEGILGTYIIHYRNLQLNHDHP